MKNGLCFIVVFLLLNVFSSKSFGQVLESDSLALVDLYNATGGQNWTVNTNWNTTSLVSTWHGISITGDRVTTINLQNNNLIGDVPSSFGDLTAMESIYFHLNQLTSLPSLSNLTALQTLHLNNNDLTVLPSLENLATLHSLQVNSNFLTVLPSLENLANLQALYVSNNDLTVLPSLDNLANLQALYVSNNDLTVLPSLDNLTALQILYVNNNDLIVLPSLDNLTNLQTLYVQNNNIIDLPSLDNLTNLQNLSIHNNKIDSLPSLDNLTALQSLSVYGNQIDSLPNLDNLTGLEALYIQDNEIDSLPNLNNLLNLQTFFCANNRLTFLDLEPILTHPNNTPSFTFNWHPQKPSIPIQGLSAVTYEDAANNNIPVDFSMAPDAVSTTYQWQKDDVDLLGETDLMYSYIMEMDTVLQTYQVVMSHPDFTGTINSLPKTVAINGLDEEGGLFDPYQLIIEFTDEAAAEMAELNNLAADFNAVVVDRCDCSKILQVWEFCDLLGEGVDIGDRQNINDINEIKTNLPPEESCIDNASFNYYINSDGIDSYNIPLAKPKAASTSNNPTPLKIAIIDSGYKNDVLIDKGYGAYYTDWLRPEDTACEFLPISDCDGNTVSRSCESPPYEAGYNFVNSCEDPNSAGNNDHATQMAAIILGQLSSTTETVELMNLKAFRPDGKGTLFDAICAVYFASEYEADMINLSWSYRGQASSTLGNALDRAINTISAFPTPDTSRVLIFASAGNGLYNGEAFIGQDLGSKSYFPAAHTLDNLVTVAATDGNQLTEFSNYSDNLVEVAAPGIQIRTGLDGLSSVATGTSPATAFVTGMAAAYWCHNFNDIDSSQQVIEEMQLYGVMDDMGSDGSKLNWEGRLDTLSYSVQINGLPCQGNATVTIQAKGGIRPYQYGNNEFESEIVLDLHPGFHTFTINDNRGFEISKVLIPDPIFEGVLIQRGIDKSGDLDGLITVEEAQSVTGTFDLSNEGINDLSGIGAFINITTLDCSDNNLTCISVPSFIRTLNCSNNQLDELIVPEGLRSLDCSYNSIQSLDLSKNNILSVDCSNNNLTDFNIRNGHNLNITNFDATENPNLLCISVDDAIYATQNWTNIHPNTSFSTNCGDLLICSNWTEVAMGDAVGTVAFNECGENKDFTLSGTAYLANGATSDTQIGAYRSLCGDGEVIIQWESNTNDPTAHIGIELRETLDAGAKKVAVVRKSGNMIVRHRAIENTSTQGAIYTISNRIWYKIERFGNQFSWYHSTNGCDWFIRGVKSISMADCIEFGVIAYATNTSITDAELDNLWITGFTEPSVNTTELNFTDTNITATPGESVNVCVDINEACACNLTEVDVRLSDNSSAMPHLTNFSPTTLYFDGETGQACFELSIDNVSEAATYQLILENPSSRNFVNIGINGSLTINVEATPTCMNDLVLTETINEGTEMFLDMSITSTATINGPADVTYQAVTDIILNPNFAVNLGATFSAFISDEGCDGNPNLTTDNNDIVDNRANNQPSTQDITDLKIYPNPLSETATIVFSIPTEQVLTVSIYNHMGRLVKTIATETIFEAGEHRLELAAQDLPNGIYYCSLQSENFRQSKKLLVLHSR